MTLLQNGSASLSSLTLHPTLKLATGKILSIGLSLRDKAAKMIHQKFDYKTVNYVQISEIKKKY